MVKTAAFASLGIVVGSIITIVIMVSTFGWGSPPNVPGADIAATRAQFVDLILVIASVLLGAVGLFVAVGAIVIGVISWKTLREIKGEAAEGAKQAAAEKIEQSLEANLLPSINAKLNENLQPCIEERLVDMAKRGELDEAVERVISRMNRGDIDPKPDPSTPDEDGSESET